MTAPATRQTLVEYAAARLPYLETAVDLYGLTADGDTRKHARSFWQAIRYETLHRFFAVVVDNPDDPMRALRLVRNALTDLAGGVADPGVDLHRRFAAVAALEALTELGPYLSDAELRFAVTGKESLAARELRGAE